MVGAGRSPAARTLAPVSRKLKVSASRPSGPRLLADAEGLDHAAIPLQVVPADVVEEPTAAADEHQEAAPGVVVLRVRLEVLGQVVDALAEERDLHLGRSAVGLMLLILLDQLRLFLGIQGHFRGALL